MKKVGYPSHFSGAVEAASSTGGQITPPILGAAAFIMVEYLDCLLYTSPSPRDRSLSRMPSSA